MKKTISILLLLILAFAVGFYVLRQAHQDIQTSIEQFFSRAASNDPGAATYLDPSFPESDTLLQSLAIPNLFLLNDIDDIRLQSLNMATATIILGLGKNDLHQVEAALVKTAEGWKISSLPQLVLVPVAFMVEQSAETVTFLTGEGQRLTFKQTDDTMDLTETEQRAGMLVGVGDKIALFDEFKPIEMKKLLTITDDALEGEQTGFFTLAEDTPFFRREDSLQVATVNDLIVGMQNITLYQQEDMIKAVEIPADFVPDTIRVALNTTDFGELLHQQITLSGDHPLTLEDKVAGSTTRITVGTSITITAMDNQLRAALPSGDQDFTNRLFIIPDAGRIRVETIERGNPRFTPAYPGHLEMRAVNGNIQLVNEVPLESYLYSVVPSEMPVSFGVEPLKVQAVAARSYAVSSIYRSGFRGYAAHVDDSVSSQVYNNVPEYPESNLAVNETAGRILMFNDAIADTRFFSTSSGVTGNFSDVWHDPETGAFPAPTIPYLISKPQLADGSLPDVTTEEGARTFFTTNEWDGYDKSSPWFRWEVEMTRAELEASLNQYLPERQRAQEDYVLTEENGNFIAKEIPANPLGELQDIRVINRGGGGNIMELEISGAHGTYRLLKEYTIRFTLRPVKTSGNRDIALERHDGSTLLNYSILPSTFMVMDIERTSDDRIDTVLFRGGGNGHGVGMSQWGSRGMAGRGYTYDTILEHFYPQTTLEILY